MKIERVLIKSKYYENEGERGYIDYYVFGKKCPNAVTFLSDIVESFKELTDTITYFTSEASSHIRYIDMQCVKSIYNTFLHDMKDLSYMVECIRSNSGDVWYNYNAFERNIKRYRSCTEQLSGAFQNIITDDSYDIDKIEKALNKLLFEIEYAYKYIKNHSERV